MGAHISSVEICGPDLAPAHKTKMQAVAECILNPAPPYLCAVLSDWSFEIWSQHSIDSIWPTKAEMRASLAETAGLTINLYDALQDPALKAFLSANSGMSEDSLDAFASSLPQLAAFLSQSRNSPQIVGKDGRILRGPGKAVLPNVMPPKYTCAAIIAEATAHVLEQGHPQPSKRSACAAANRLWTSWIKSESWGNDPLTAWKPYFLSVDDPRLQPLRREVRRHLNVRAASARMLESIAA
jgi:hypothetical protein